MRRSVVKNKMVIPFLTRKLSEQSSVGIYIESVYNEQDEQFLIHESNQGIVAYIARITNYCGTFMNSWLLYAALHSIHLDISNLHKSVFLCVMLQISHTRKQMTVLPLALQVFECQHI